MKKKSKHLLIQYISIQMKQAACATSTSKLLVHVVTIEINALVPSVRTNTSIPLDRLLHLQDAEKQFSERLL